MNRRAVIFDSPKVNSTLVKSAAMKKNSEEVMTVTMTHLLDLLAPITNDGIEDWDPLV
jgi:hypothetical protein